MPQELCREAAYSEDYYDLIINYLSEYASVPGDCEIPVDDIFTVSYYQRAALQPLNLQDYPYSSIPKCYTLCDSTALEVSGILRLQNPDGLDLTGRGILVGFVDTGIDYTNDCFKNLDNTTRIAAIWDQTERSGMPPEDFHFGSVYTRTQINEALQSENPLGIVPHTDPLGHGTFLASIACGNNDPLRDFTGAAFEAAIAMVKCKEAKQYLRSYYFIPEQVPCYQENDIMLGIAWLKQLAENMGMPLIVCLGMGTSMGNHDGEDPLSVQLEGLGRRRQRAVVAPTGNESTARHHYSSREIAVNQQEFIEISVGEQLSGFTMEFWASAPEIYNISVLSPTGERLQGRPSGIFGSETITFLFEQTVLTVEYTIAGPRLGAQLIFLRFSRPYPGIWTLEVTPELLISGIFHCWLPQTELLAGNVFFLRPDPENTILAPGYSPTAVTAGAYDADSGSVYPQSGRGYSTTGAIKPDILAPAVSVYGIEPRNFSSVRTGTSISSAITAGASAQIFQWAIVENNLLTINSADLANLFIRGARRIPDRPYPSPIYGYGYLDAFGVLLTLRER